MKHKSTEDIKEEIIKAGHIAVQHLIKVAQEDIIKPNLEDDLAADRLKNAAATKKLCIFDAFDILNKIESEKENINAAKNGTTKADIRQGFAERRSK